MLTLIHPPLPALHPGLWRHHRHPADPGRAALHRRQQRRQESAHLHHLLRVGDLHAAADGRRHQVASELRLFKGLFKVLKVKWEQFWGKFAR